MKLRAQRGGLAVAAIMAAAYAVDTLVAISGDATVTKAINATAPIGRVTVAAAAAAGSGTVELSGRFKELIEIKTGGVLAAGAKVKMAAADGTTGENVIVAWVAGTDAEDLALGVVWKGAASGAVAEVLTY